jgi:ABC-2 type transport system ATP-binding protein
MMDVVEKVSDRIILLNEGVVIADGSIEELRLQKGDGSLEKIFAQLTATESNNQAADHLIQAFEL